jgi:hypothetical protein
MENKAVVALLGAARTMGSALASPLLRIRKQTAPPSAASSAPERRSATTSLVDILASSYSRVGCSVVELKLQNPSDQIVFLKRAEIEVLGQWDIPQRGNPYAVPVSWTYDADLSSGRARIRLSHAIEPNQVDRFEITVGCKTVEGKHPFSGLFLYLIRLTIFNESRRGSESRLQCPKMLVHIPCPMEVVGYSSYGMSRDFVAQNKARAQEALAAIGDDTVVEAELLEGLRSWAQADPSEFAA